MLDTTQTGLLQEGIPAARLQGRPKTCQCQNRVAIYDGLTRAQLDVCSI